MYQIYKNIQNQIPNFKYYYVGAYEVKFRICVFTYFLNLLTEICKRKKLNT